MSFTVPRVYPITDTKLSGLLHVEQVRQLIEGGATLIQLREKDLNPREFYREAEVALKLAHTHSVRLIINDRVDIALALKADGTHLGQADLPPAEARTILGDEAIIGFSTHNIEQARAASTLPVDYLAVGPIFSTASKKAPDPVVGLSGLRDIRAVIDRLPIVAIGGITLANASEVLAAGADSVAMISGMLVNGNTASRMRESLRIWKK